ncbi:MAG: hypothetical protein ISR65_19690 [Bacteriovoracaceae bacterium]|nr:hypothetical protein [Bacteriovoracaceae bacterium]
MLLKKKSLSLAAVTLLVGTNFSYGYAKVAQNKFIDGLSGRLAAQSQQSSLDLNLNLKLSVDRDLLETLRDIRSVEELDEENVQLLLKAIQEAAGKASSNGIERLYKGHNYDVDSLSAKKIVF